MFLNHPGNVMPLTQSLSGPRVTEGCPAKHSPSAPRHSQEGGGGACHWPWGHIWLFSSSRQRGSRRFSITHLPLGTKERPARFRKCTFFNVILPINPSSKSVWHSYCVPGSALAATGPHTPALVELTVKVK